MQSTGCTIDLYAKYSRTTRSRRRGRSTRSGAEVHPERGGGASRLASSSNEGRPSFRCVPGPSYQESTRQKGASKTVKQYRPINSWLSSAFNFLTLSEVDGKTLIAGPLTTGPYISFFRMFVEQISFLYKIFKFFFLIWIELIFPNVKVLWLFFMTEII